MEEPRDVSISVFLFAHQDDEVNVLSIIESHVLMAQRTVCIYMTNGRFGNVSSDRRNAESMRVLYQLGVAVSDIHFLGQSMEVPDGKLYEHLEGVFTGCYDLMILYGTVQTLFIPAYEGGHQDHDAAHLIGLALARGIGVLDKTFQFSGYHGKGLPWIFFKVMSPIPENGLVVEFPIPWSLRLKYLGFCFYYLSQWKTWIGLLPFVVLHYLVHGTQQLQNVSFERAIQKPHSGKLLYEKRCFLEYKIFLKTATPFIQKYIGNNSQCAKSPTSE